MKSGPALGWAGREMRVNLSMLPDLEEQTVNGSCGTKLGQGCCSNCNVFVFQSPALHPTITSSPCTTGAVRVLSAWL